MTKPTIIIVVQGGRVQKVVSPIAMKVIIDDSCAGTYHFLITKAHGRSRRGGRRIGIPI